MANINLTADATTAKRINVAQSVRQLTVPAAEAIVAGAPVRFDTAAGTLTNANGTTAPEARVWGIALNSSDSGAVTVVRNGIVDGFDLSGLDYDDPVYLSDTDGRIADTAGTVSTVIGRVVPGTAVTNGTALDKLLSIEL